MSLVDDNFARWLEYECLGCPLLEAGMCQQSYPEMERCLRLEFTEEETEVIENGGKGRCNSLLCSSRPTSRD